MTDRTPVHIPIIGIFSGCVAIVSFIILSLFFGHNDGFYGALIVFTGLFFGITIIGTYVHRDKFRGGKNEKPRKIN